MAGSRFTPAAWSALAFALAYLTAAGIGALAVGDREFLVYLVVVGGATATVAWLHRRARFSPAVLWGVSLLGAIHMAGGLVRPPMSWPIDGRRVLYNLWLVPEWLKYDQAVHFYGSAMATWACWQSLRTEAGLGRATAGPVVLCALGGIGLGAINEVAEFLTTRVVSETNVGGYENTGWDLVANLAGAAAAGVLIRVFGRTTDVAAGGGCFAVVGRASSTHLSDPP